MFGDDALFGQPLARAVRTKSERMTSIMLERVYRARVARRRGESDGLQDPVDRLFPSADPKSQVDPDVGEPDDKEQDEQKSHHETRHAVEKHRHGHRRIVEPSVLIDRASTPNVMPTTTAKNVAIAPRCREIGKVRPMISFTV